MHISKRCIGYELKYSTSLQIILPRGQISPHKQSSVTNLDLSLNSRKEESAHIFVEYELMQLESVRQSYKRTMINVNRDVLDQLGESP